MNFISRPSLWHPFPLLEELAIISLLFFWDGNKSAVQFEFMCMLSHSERNELS